MYNGSPRKTWNTAQLLQSALKGAEDCGSTPELIHLYDYAFNGFYSYLACKRKDKPTDLCSYPDGLQQIFEQFRKADGVILGSPIYNGTDTSVIRAFVERLNYPFLLRAFPFKKPFATFYDLVWTIWDTIPVTTPHHIVCLKTSLISAKPYPFTAHTSMITISMMDSEITKNESKKPRGR